MVSDEKIQNIYFFKCWMIVMVKDETEQLKTTDKEEKERRRRREREETKGDIIRAYTSPKKGDGVSGCFLFLCIPLALACRHRSLSLSVFFCLTIIIVRYHSPIKSSLIYVDYRQSYN